MPEPERRSGAPPKILQPERDEASREVRRLCGIGDEAAPTADDQIAAFRELGWPQLELRSVDGQALAELDDESFDRLAGRLHACELTVPVLCSRIGSWYKPSPGAFEDDVRELKVLAHRARDLGSRYVRIMSFPAPELEERAARDLAVNRIRRLSDVAHTSGLTLLHENCVGWAGGAHPERVLELLEAVGSEALGVLFDLGNGLAYGYEPLDFLKAVVPHVVHVHVKDGRRAADEAPGGEREVSWVLPGQGEARVRECLELLLDSGYEGLFSIEPHLQTVPHLGKQAQGEEARRLFVSYGRHFEDLLSSMLVNTGSSP
jgi:sugar phosphate isomerase/epimerase